MYNNLKNLLDRFIKKKPHKEEYKLELRDDFIDTSTEDEFEKKITCIKNDKESNFPSEYTTNGQKVIFEKDKYFNAAKKMYKNMNINKHIEKIEVVDNLNNQGECSFDKSSNELKISIRISWKQLGLISHSGYIYPYSEERCNDFISVLSHELFHAKDLIDIYVKFGLDELTNICNSGNKLAFIAFSAITEYNACRKVAEKYNSYDSEENIDNNIHHIDTCITNAIKDKKSNIINTRKIVNLNYAIATKCAFEEASGNQKKYLSIENTQKFKQYIERLKDLLNENYEHETLNNEEYTEVGKDMVSCLLHIYELPTQSIDEVISYLY